MQDIEHGAVQVSRLRADVVAGTAVDLVEQLLLGLRGIALQAADAAKQCGLAIVQRETVVREHRAGRVVPAEDRAGELEVEGLALPRA